MIVPDLSSTSRTALRRHRERGQSDRDDLYAVLDAGLICHLGVIANCAFGLASLSAQLFFPAQQLSLANQFPNSRAAILAWNNSALFLGISLGSLVGGQAIALGGFETDLIIAAAIAIVGWIANQDSRRGHAEVRITPPHQPCGVGAG